MTDLKKEARGRMCTVQIFGVCNKNPETSVLAHLNVQGLNTKANDLHACIACSACHEWLDHAYTLGFTRYERDYEHLMAIIKTQRMWLEKGFI